MDKKTSERMNLGKLNYILLAVSALLLIVGYFIMSLNDIVISPILLAIVYVCLIPLALLIRTKKTD
ncbi:MAG: hypothetical protein PHI68_07905 [Candidatus Cloacimonetes bacterium]|nr:hypothetical protein [Candidatus Cloacimonadota bacterium]